MYILNSINTYNISMTLTNPFDCLILCDSVTGLPIIVTETENTLVMNNIMLTVPTSASISYSLLSTYVSPPSTGYQFVGSQAGITLDYNVYNKLTFNSLSTGPRNIYCNITTSSTSTVSIFNPRIPIITPQSYMFILLSNSTTTRPITGNIQILEFLLC